MEVTLKQITRKNYRAVAKLHIPDEQQEHLSENIWSIAEAQLHDTHEARAIYVREEPVGFIMWVQQSDTMASIWRFMVAHKHQNKGIGRAALLKAFDEIKASSREIETIEISYGPENTVAKGLYSSLGFTQVSIADDGEEAYAHIRVRPKDSRRLVNMPESEILEIAKPIHRDVISANNARKWEYCTKHMSTDDAEDTELRAHVEKQWEEDAYLTSLSTSSTYKGITRNADTIIVHWKQPSTLFDEVRVLDIHIAEIDGKVMLTGVWLN